MTDAVRVSFFKRPTRESSVEDTKYRISSAPQLQLAATAKLPTIVAAIAPPVVSALVRRATSEMLVATTIPATTQTGRPDTPTARLQRELSAHRAALQSTAQGKIGLFKSAAPIVLLCMIPFAVLFSAVMLATCSFARTFKEAQNYMMPVMMCAVIPAMVVSYMPSIKLQGLLLVAPDIAVGIIVEDDRHDIDAMLHGGRQFSTGEQKAPIASQRHDGPIGVCHLDSKRHRKAGT